MLSLHLSSPATLRHCLALLWTTVPLYDSFISNRRQASNMLDPVHTTHASFSSFFAFVVFTSLLLRYANAETETIYNRYRTTGLHVTVHENCSYQLFWRGEDGESTPAADTFVCRSSPTAFFLDGKWHIEGDTLRCEGIVQNGHRVHLRWRAPGVSIEGLIETRSPSNAVVFEYKFLDPGRIHPTNRSVAGLLQYSKRLVSNFPALEQCTLRGRLSWEGSFVQPRKNCATDGPCVMYDNEDPVHGLAVFASPLNNFPMMTYGTACAGERSCDWTAALPASVKVLPEGFTQRFVVVGANAGVTQVVNDWGEFMRKMYKTKRVFDVTIRSIGYQTDNGAQYCFCKSECDQKLLDVSRYLKEDLGIPLQYMSFQNAWWPSTGSAPWCVEAWEEVKKKIPMGVHAFHKRLALPLQLYSPYLCSQTPYGKSFQLLRSNPKLEGCSGFDFQQPRPYEARKFYSFLFNIGVQFGMVNFEIDFVNQNLQCVNEYFIDVSAASSFLDGLNKAADERNVTMQWCFANPNAALQSLKYGRVTNMRASFDFYYGESWDIGTSSLFLWALDIQPSTDTFWTTPNGNLSTSLGGCDRKQGCPADHQEDGCELHTLLAVMSKGPVGFSDAIGMSDPVRLRRTIRGDGVLLQPTKPITQLDRFSPFLGASIGASVLGSYSGESRLLAYYIVAHHLDELKQPVVIKSSDLWPKVDRTLPPKGGVVVRELGKPLCWEPAGMQSEDRKCGLRVVDFAKMGNDAPLITLVASPSTFRPELYTITPVSGNGWSLLGEVDKYVALADARFSNVEEIMVGDKRKGHFQLKLHGAAMHLEEVNVVAVQAYTGEIARLKVTIPANQTSVVAVI